MMYQLKQRTFVNSDRTKVVEETSPEAAFLLGPAGFRISEEYAQELGLLQSEEVEDESGDAGEVEEGEGEVDEVAGGEENGEVDGEQSKAAELPEDKSLEPAENKGVQFPKNNQQFNTTMTILENAGVEREHLPTMLDADLLSIDGISRTRLELIRKYFPPMEENDAVADSSTDSGTL